MTSHDRWPERGINVEELETECSSAPMSGESLFRAKAQLKAPADAFTEDLRNGLEDLANELMVDINLDEVSPD